MAKEELDKEWEALRVLVTAIFAESDNQNTPDEDLASFNQKTTGPVTAEHLKLWKGMASQLISVSDAAKLRNISRISMYELMDRGRLHVLEFGGKKFLIKKEVEEFEREKPGPKSEREKN